MFGIDVTPDGKIFSASADKTARLHTFGDGKAIRTFSGQTDWVYSVAFNPATKKVAAGSYSGQVRIWNSEDGKQALDFTAAPGFEKKPEAK